MAKKEDLPIVKRSLFSWVLRGPVWPQVILLIVILLIVFLRVLPLEIQKRIVNEVLALKSTSLLLVYCLIYFCAVLLASGLKFVINWLQTLIGQRAMTDMRREVYSHILRLPLSFFRRTQAGTVSSALINELAPSATFIGTAIAVPLTNVLTLFAFAIYLIRLNPLLGVCTLVIYPIALFVVPLLQRGANKANKQRVDGTREMANRITESISGIHEIHGHGAFWSEEQKYNSIIEKLLRIRIIWTLYRYGVKVANNLFVALGPVIVFTLGGYLMIQGEIELGSIVAFLSAQEKLYDPWKELIEFYQVYQDASVRYNKVMETFDENTEFMLEQSTNLKKNLSGTIELKDVEFSPAKGIMLLDRINLKVEAGEHMALVGFSGSGKSTLAQCIAQLHSHTGGEILINGHPISLLAKEEVVKSIGIIAQKPLIFTGTVDDNLLYAHRAIASYSLSGKTVIQPSLDDKITVLQQTALFIDVLRFGLNSVIDIKANPDLQEKILKMRHNFQSSFGLELASQVEFFQEDRFLFHSSVMENLIFGTPLEESFFFDNLINNKAFIGFLDTCSLRLPLLETGAELIRQTVDILGNVPKEELFFGQTPVQPENYDRCCDLAKKLQGQSITQLNSEEHHLVLEIALHYIPSLHKIIVLQPLLEKLILTGRREFRRWCVENSPKAVSFFSDTQYMGAQSILNNIFFGNLITTTPKVEDRVNQCIVFLLVEEDLLERIVAIGLDFEVGNMGDKLSGGQQQKLAIARVLLKKPIVLIMDEATSALDNSSQSRIQKMLEKLKGTCSVISVIHRLDILPSYDKVAVMKNGRIIEWGEPKELLETKGALYELVHGKNN